MPRKPNTPADSAAPKKQRQPREQFAFTLSKTASARIRAAASLYDRPIYELVQLLARRYEATAFEPHLAKLVGEYEAVRVGDHEAKLKDILGGFQEAVPVPPSPESRDLMDALKAAGIAAGGRPDRESLAAAVGREG